VNYENHLIVHPARRRDFSGWLPRDIAEPAELASERRCGAVRAIATGINSSAPDGSGCDRAGEAIIAAAEGRFVPGAFYTGRIDGICAGPGSSSTGGDMVGLHGSRRRSIPQLECRGDSGFRWDSAGIGRSFVENESFVVPPTTAPVISRNNWTL